jgi:peroxiredoxin
VLVSIGLLAVFSAAVSWTLARGRRPDCHCFGSVRPRPISWTTLARNCILAVIAVALAAYTWTDTSTDWPGRVVVAEGPDISNATLVLAAIIAVESFLLLRLLGKYGRLLARLDRAELRLSTDSPTSSLLTQDPLAELKLGTAAPAFALTDLEGRVHTLERIRAEGKRVVLVFADPSCAACRELVPEFSRWEQQHQEKLTLVIIVSGSARHLARSMRVYRSLERVLVESDREVMNDYGARGTPSAIIVDKDGLIASPLVRGASAIRALIARAAEAPMLLRLASRDSRAMAGADGVISSLSEIATSPPAGNRMSDT